jgi:hypothetical protein
MDAEARKELALNVKSGRSKRLDPPACSGRVARLALSNCRTSHYHKTGYGSITPGLWRTTIHKKKSCPRF